MCARTLKASMKRMMHSPCPVVEHAPIDESAYLGVHTTKHTKQNKTQQTEALQRPTPPVWWVLRGLACTVAAVRARARARESKGLMRTRLAAWG